MEQFLSPWRLGAQEIVGELFRLQPGTPLNFSDLASTEKAWRKQVCETSMDFTGFQWISIDLSRFQWISIDFSRFQWISIDFSRFQWISPNCQCPENVERIEEVATTELVLSRFPCQKLMEQRKEIKKRISIDHSSNSFTTLILVVFWMRWLHPVTSSSPRSHWAAPSCCNGQDRCLY